MVWCGMRSSTFIFNNIHVNLNANYSLLQDLAIDDVRDEILLEKEREIYALRESLVCKYACWFVWFFLLFGLIALFSCLIGGKARA